MDGQVRAITQAKIVDRLMTRKKAEVKVPATLDKTLSVLEELNGCRPLKAGERRTNVEILASRFAKWALIVAAILLAPPVVLALFIDPSNPPSDFVKTIALGAIALSMTLAVASLIVPILASGWILFRWEKVSYQALRDDLIHEYAMAEQLRKHGNGALMEAKMWLELRIKRVEARVTWFFGDKTAVLGLLATAYVFSKEFGGFKWLEKTLRAGPGLSNLGDSVLMYTAALIFGLSLGAVFVKHIAARYRYQVELIDLSLR